eukprot:11997676-Prorocentrum_lima.AAC.1
MLSGTNILGLSNHVKSYSMSWNFVSASSRLSTEASADSLSRLTNSQFLALLVQCDDPGDGGGVGSLESRGG